MEIVSDCTVKSRSDKGNGRRAVELARLGGAVVGVCVIMGTVPVPGSAGAYTWV